MPRPMRRRRPGESGFVLVAVLWLGVALALAASGFLSDTRRASYRVRAEVGTAAAMEMARSALNLALADLARPKGTNRNPRDGTATSMVVPGGTVRFSIRDEKGKIDLNRTRPSFLAAALAQLGGRGLDALDHASLADRLLKAARDAREAGTAPSLAELLADVGLAPEVAARASLVMTLHSYTARVNPQTAPAEVLSAVPELNADEVAGILDARRYREPLPSLGRAQGAFIQSEGPVYSIHATGRTEAGITATMTAMVMAEGRTLRTGRMRFRVLEMRIAR
ncbi:MAG: hypothetical protein AAF160_05735 [Pseudomonadota bacterium]